MNYLMLLAEATDTPHWFDKLMQPPVLGLLVGAAEIIGGVAYAVTHAIISHRERMEMLKQGINPDAVYEDKPKE